MFDEKSDGIVYFRYKTSPNWVEPGSKSYELLVIESDDFEDDENLGYSPYYIIQREEYINKGKIVEEFSEGKIYKKEDLNLFEPINISKEDFTLIIDMIEKNKDLSQVDSEIFSQVCDGSHEELFFFGRTFNRAVEGDCITDKYFLERDCQYCENMNLYRAFKQSKIVAKAFNDVYNLLKQIALKSNKEL